MTAKTLVPELSESVSEPTVGRWLKHDGDSVRQGEAVVETGGVLVEIERDEGDRVQTGDMLATIDERSEEKESERQRVEKAGSERGPPRDEGHEVGTVGAFTV
jgi:2-oxoglutarate dehydrogenase E2 component (dihydrolipoamide succinyltransferase)